MVFLKRSLKGFDSIIISNVCDSEPFIRFLIKI